MGNPIRVLIAKPGLDGHDRILSGAHLPIAKKLMKMMKEEGLDEAMVLIGGNIPKSDVKKLKSLGVKEVFPTGSKFEEIVKFIQSNTPN
ncbi:MAG: cobalamin B12-binding domain-containing protein [Candidatus Thorarchaeota archaeon]|jgi:methylmalonyl-CoA mutase C-terminal domain/subunit